MSTTDHHPAEKALSIARRIPAEPPDVRASTAERDAVVAVLYRALADGRLDLAETDARVTHACAARLRGDLRPLLSDLPDDRPEPAVPPAPTTLRSFWAALARRARAVVLAVVVGLLLLGGAIGAASSGGGGGGGGGAPHSHGQELGPAARR